MAYAILVCPLSESVPFGKGRKWTPSSKNRSGSSSSRVDANVVTYDPDVDQVITEEKDHRNKRDKATTESDDDDDAGIFSIPNDYPAQIMTTSMMNRKRRGFFLKYAQGELNKTTPSQQKDFC